VAQEAGRDLLDVVLCINLTRQ